jgi:hypothetical protein
LRDRIKNFPADVASANQHLTQWNLKLNGRLSEYDKTRVQSIAARLRRAANSAEIDFVEASGGSSVLREHQLLGSL